MEIELKISGDVDHKLKTKAGQVQHKIRELLWDVGTAVRNAMVSVAPRGKNSPGHTGRTLKLSHKIWRTGSTRLNVGPDERIAPYAKGVIKGNPPHIIEPKHKKALYWKGAKYPVKRVNHPGNKPNDYRVKARLYAAPERYRLETEFASWMVKI